MKLPSCSSGIFAVSVLFLWSLVLACDPLTQTGCPADPALGRTVNVDFTDGASSEFTASYNIITYESDGVHLTVSEHGDAPILVSNWYIMFGRFEIVFKSAPGVGMVSSAILQSDDLDEIDWELLGATPTEAQTNYFGRGVTETYDREVTVADPTSQSGFNTYVIDWNQDRIIWSLNGATLRTLYAADADIDSSGKTEYPQTPMQIKIGAWAGGDPANAPGTISWAGGEINYGEGPYTMVVQSVSVTDYSTGTEYEYSGTSGSWKDITAVGGAVLSGGSGSASASSASSSATSSTTISSTVTSSTVVSSGTTSTSSSIPSSSHETFPTSTTSSVDTHTGWPWVASSTSLSSPATAAATTSTMTYSTGSSTSSTAAVTSSSASPSPYSSATYSSTTAEETSSTALQTSTFPASSTSDAATIQSATSIASTSVPVYTGGAGHMAVAKIGIAACVAAGLAFAV